MDCKSGIFRRTVIYLLVLIGGATGVRNLEMIVPAMVRSGDSARLSCRYILEGPPLYTIQWYLGDQEFYRYVPKKSPPQLSHPVQGIQIDVLQSDMNDVTLRNVSRELTGTYKCEVTEDGPDYHTMAQQKSMQVADIPETDPVIEVERQRIPAGETLRANCTSGTSYPVPNIMWLVNGNRLNDTMMHYNVSSRTNTRDKMEYAWTGLELKLSSRTFKNGRLRLGCSANMPGIYDATVEIEVNEDRPLIASITGDASPHSDRSSGVGRAELLTMLSTDGLARSISVIGGLLVSIAHVR